MAVARICSAFFCAVERISALRRPMCPASWAAISALAREACKVVRTRLARYTSLTAYTALRLSYISIHYAIRLFNFSVPYWSRQAPLVSMRRIPDITRAAHGLQIIFWWSMKQDQQGTRGEQTPVLPRAPVLGADHAKMPMQL